MDASTETNHSSREHVKRPRGRARLVPVAGVLAVALAGGALSGCASLLLQSELGPPATGVREEVLRYDWAGRRGDEVVVAYTVRGDRTEEARWVSLDLREVVWTPSGAASVGVLRPVPAPRPDPASMDAVPLIPRAVGTAGSRTSALAAIARAYPLAIQAQVGREPVLALVASDPTSPGEARVTTWQIELGRAPARPEPVGRGLSRTVLAPAALAVDVVTSPLQLLFFGVVGMR